MQVKTENTCDQCRRPTEQAVLKKVEYEQHVGHVCSMCHYIFQKQQNQERFKHMIRQKTFEQSSIEMKEVHRLLSMLITIGVVFCVLIASAMIIQMTNAIPTIDLLFSAFLERFSHLNFIQYIKSN